MFTVGVKLDLTCYVGMCLKIKKEKKLEGTPGIEPGTSRSAVECSTTELYPHRKLQNNITFKSKV